MKRLIPKHLNSKGKILSLEELKKTDYTYQPTEEKMMLQKLAQ